MCAAPYRRSYRKPPMFKRIDQLPLLPIALGALLLGTAPLSGQPHLLEKLGMLVHGELVRPIDIFDLVMHGSLPLLLVIKLVRMGLGKKAQEPGPPPAE